MSVCQTASVNFYTSDTGSLKFCFPGNLSMLSVPDSADGKNMASDQPEAANAGSAAGIAAW